MQHSGIDGYREPTWGEIPEGTWNQLQPVVETFTKLLMHVETFNEYIYIYTYISVLTANTKVYMKLDDRTMQEMLTELEVMQVVFLRSRLSCCQ